MLPVEAFRRQQRHSPAASPDRAVLLVHAVGPRRLVAACCHRALDAGVRPGMTVADARGVFPPESVLVAPDDPARTASALAALGRWAHRFSPRVALDPPDGLLIDITGCDRTLGGEDTIRRTARDGLARFGVCASCVIAPTFAAAAALARHGDAGIIRDADLRQAVANLPIAALRLDPKHAAGLAEVGLDRVGQVMDLPRSVLPARFGGDLLLQLDRLLGRAMETIDTIRPDEPVRVSIVFDGPTHRWESIEAVVRSLITDLCDRLARHDTGVTRAVLTLTRSDLPPAALAFTLSMPSHDPKHLWSLIRPRLERTHLGFGVEALDLLAERTARIGHTQAHAWSSAEAGVAEREALARLVDGLTNRLGRERVLRAGLVHSHRPERAVALVPAHDPTPEDVSTGPERGAFRPTTLLAEPEPVTVIALTPDGPVHRLTRGEQSLEVLTCLGPERIGPEWWRVARRHARTRDYFSLQTADGRWVWVFRELESGSWYLHGVWG